MSRTKSRTGFARADLLRVVGREHDAGGGNFHERGLHRGDRACKARGVEHHVVVEIVVEVLFGFSAVAGLPFGAPEVLVLIAADAPSIGGDAAREVRHVHGEIGVAVEHAGIDQPDRRHDQREFAADRTRGVEAVELLRVVELERRMHEHEQAELFRLGPERLVFGVVEKEPVGLRRDHHALEAELVLAAVELLHGLGAAMRMRHARRR